MDHRSLQCFIALAEELHFGRASKRANISQPGLSGQIGRLEQRLGGKLFERSTRRVELTLAGSEFLPHARRALRSMELGLRSFRASQFGVGGRLAIAVTNISAEWGAYDLISQFSELYPGVSVETREITSNSQEDGLQNGTIDIGFLHPPLRKCISFRDLGQDAIGAALRRDHPLAKNQTLTIADLAEEPLIVFPRENGPTLFSRIEVAFKRANVEPYFSEFATPLTLGLRAAAAGRGIALVSECYARTLPDGVVYRPIVDLDVHLPIAIGWHYECANAAVAMFREHCEQHLD